VVAVNWVERRRSFVYPALMSVGMGVLAACAEKPPPPPPPTVAIEPPPLPPPRPPRPRVFPLPAHKPLPPSENEAGGPESGAEAMALATPEPIVRTPGASELIGLDQPTAKHLFGAATEQSDAPPGTIWRYRNATCELDLFFYLEVRSGKMRTLRYAFKGEPAKSEPVDPDSRQDCLRSLIVARGG
jgi:hypothetical protein